MALPAPCSWQLTLPNAGLRCAVHDESAYPWRSVPGCALPVAQVCHACVRAAVPIEHRFSWSFLCHTCATIDTALGRRHGASAMTPHCGQSGTDRETVFGRLHPDRVSRLEVVEASAAPGGLARLETRDVRPEGDGWLRQLADHRAMRASVMVVALRGEACAAPGSEEAEEAMRIPWAEWQEAFPPSARASAEAYQGYVGRLHPWVHEVEPAVSDVDWVVGLVRG